MKAPVYVVQKHDARALHYDFRLEKGGVLKSWAVPKGVPLRGGEKHLAVQVEDHDIGYASFEGAIPEGQYGAGTVEIWDSGTFREESWGEGKIIITIAGKKVKGTYVLLRMRQKPGEKGDNWLLFRKSEK